MAATTNRQKTNTVLGKVTDGNGRPLANLKVAIYDVDMREWQPLADTFTNREGKYELQWTHEQLSGRGLKEAAIAKGITMMELNNSKNKLSELGLETHETTTVQ